jgi:sec-independent protein translocase protein TatB
MSGVSSAELLLLLVIGLIVLGPKRLPEIAQKIGGWVGQARRMTRVMKRQLEEELKISEISQIGQPELAPSKQQSSAPAMHQSAGSDTPPVPSEPARDEELVDDHIPRDDDAYSPLHEKDRE